MVAHGRALHLAKRQSTDPLAIPTAAGISGGVTSVATAAATTASGLAIDTGAATTGIGTAPNLVPTDTNAPTVTSTPSVTSAEPTDTAATEQAAAAASKNIALSTVIGTCVGAFIGATALIIFGFWIYRRYSRSLKKRALSRGPLSRNMTADQARRRSRLEPWNKLEDGDDKWEGMYQTKERETDQVAPMEKLTMFKKTPSVRTAYTHKSTDVSAFDFPQSYADFDPKLAETLSTSSGKMPEPKPFMGRVDADPPQSWDSNASKSFLSVRTQMSSGAMSPTLHMAIPTPPPTASQAHVWESAEVVHYSEAQTANVEQFDQSQGDDQRRSTHNPFFNARDDDRLPRSRSNSVRSRSNSVTAKTPTVTKSPTAKGKERMRYSNDPFDDIHEQMPRPKFVQHLATASSSSIESKEKALQSLIAALDIPEDEVRSRLRIASMQPSLISNVSSVGGDIEDVTNEFPLPPSRPEGSSQRP